MHNVSIRFLYFGCFDRHGMIKGVINTGAISIIKISKRLIIDSKLGFDFITVYFYLKRY